MANFNGFFTFSRGKDVPLPPEANLTSEAVNVVPVPSPFAGASTSSVPPLPEMPAQDVGQKIISLGLEYERFSDRLTRELSALGALYSKVSADHQVLARNYGALSEANTVQHDALDSERARADAMSVEAARLKDELAALTNKLEREQTTHHATRERMFALNSRSESRDADYNRVVVELDQHQNALVSARSEANDLTKKLEQARVEVEQARFREADFEARNRMLNLEFENARTENKRVQRQEAELRDTLAKLNNQLAISREAKTNVEAARDSVMAERDTLIAELAQATAKIEDERRSVDAKIDALTRTKNFLWQLSEKQRKQIADQSTRIAQLEHSNTNLTQLLADSNAKEQKDVTVLNESTKAAKTPKLVQVQ